MSRSQTILVVDDVPMFRDLVALFLARTARVVQASSGRQALAILKDQPIDLLIADLHMPEMSGAALCSNIRSQPGFDSLPILMMLRNDSPHDARLAVHAGANDMICKPLARGKLIEAVNHFLERGLSTGLPRVALHTPVEIRNQILHAWGTARNISRGGIAVETDCELELKSEVAVELTLPDTTMRIAPVAEVIWSRDSEDQRTTEMGMRFVSLDSAAIRTLDEYISERTRIERGVGAHASI